MKLDRTTYEAWLLDRIEGNLTPAQERTLDAFLAANPDLNGEMHGLPTLDDAAMAPIDWKNELKKRLPPTGHPDAGRLNEFLVARLEGDLDKAQELALDKFLFEYPEHEQGAKHMAVSKTGAVQVPFEHKPTIERHFPPKGLPDKHRLTDFLIASREGDLSSEQQRALTAFFATHPEAQRDERQVAATFVATERIVFTSKEQLKKREGRVILLWQKYAVAASIALLLGFAWWMTRNEGTDGPVIAKREKVKSDERKYVVPQGPEAVTLREKEGSLVPQGPEAETLREMEQKHVVPQGPEAETLREKEKRENEEQAPMPVDRIAPAPEQQLANDPVEHTEEQHPVPLVAQDPVAPPATDLHPQQPTGVAAPATFAAAARPSDGGTPVGTVLANAVRGGVIDSEKRDASLDGDDALAIVNKGLGAITGGQGRVQVERGGARERWKLRLGRNLAISASTGR